MQDYHPSLQVPVNSSPKPAETEVLLYRLRQYFSKYVQAICQSEDINAANTAASCMQALQHCLDEILVMFESVDPNEASPSQHASPSYHQAWDAFVKQK